MDVKNSTHRWNRERGAEAKDGTTEGRGKVRTTGGVALSFPSTGKFFKLGAVICTIHK